MSLLNPAAGGTLAPEAFRSRLALVQPGLMASDLLLTRQSSQTQVKLSQPLERDTTVL